MFLSTLHEPDLVVILGTRIPKTERKTAVTHSRSADNSNLLNNWRC